MILTFSVKSLTDNYRLKDCREGQSFFRLWGKNLLKGVGGHNHL